MIIEYEVIYFPATFHGDDFFEQRRGNYFVSNPLKRKLTAMKCQVIRDHTPILFMKNVDYVCTIDNVIEVLEPKHVKLCIKKYIVSVMSCMKNLILAREKWNQCSSKIKFADNEIHFKSMTTQYDDGKAIINIKG